MHNHMKMYVLCDMYNVQGTVLRCFKRVHGRCPCGCDGCLAVSNGVHTNAEGGRTCCNVHGMCMYVYIYIYIFIYLFVYLFIYWEREREIIPITNTTGLAETSTEHAAPAALPETEEGKPCGPFDVSIYIYIYIHTRVYLYI